MCCACVCVCVSLAKQPLPHGQVWCNCVTLVVAKELLHTVCIAVDVLLCKVCIAVDVLLRNVFVVRYIGIFHMSTNMSFPLTKESMASSALPSDSTQVNPLLQ